ncbi:MAG: hypothetical protein AAGE84_06715 [Cyanobacteria bacterium P01_G01_bin.39]
MTKDMLVKDLFNNITKSSLKSSVYSKLLDELKSSLRYRSCQSKHNRVCDVIEATFGKQDSRYTKAMSHLKKLGVILSHKGTLYLNPLVETRTSAKFYELVIEYYNLLWSEEFRSSVYIKYKDFSFTLSSIEYIKQLIADDHKELLQRDEDLQHLTTQQLYDLAFTHSKNHLATPELLEDWAVSEAHLLISLKSKMGKTYSNLGHACMKAIAATHFDILCEQLPIQKLDNNEVAFGRLSKKWKCIHFSETSTYSQAIELYNLSNKQEDLQQQFEEEDFSMSSYTYDELSAVSDLFESITTSKVERKQQLEPLDQLPSAMQEQPLDEQSLDEYPLVFTPREQQELNEYLKDQQLGYLSPEQILNDSIFPYHKSRSLTPVIDFKPQDLPKDHPNHMPF